MTKNKLVIILLLLFALNLEGMVLARGTDGSSAADPDGVPTANAQRRRKRRKINKRRAKVYGIQASPDEAGTPPPAPQPAQEAAPAAAPPPPPSAPSMDTPGRGRATPAKKAAPRIKPPTVQIKPPTR